MGNAAQDLERLFADWRSGAKQLVFTREKLKSNKPVTQSNTKETSAHLARLWAFSEVTKLLAVKEGNNLNQAVQLAANYQLVTPVTGAVALETKEQYQRAGLEPVHKATVPTIPEPETRALLLVVALMLLWLMYQQRAVSLSAKAIKIRQD
jgi:hypothetical protein